MRISDDGGTVEFGPSARGGVVLLVDGEIWLHITPQEAEYLEGQLRASRLLAVHHDEE